MFGRERESIVIPFIKYEYMYLLFCVSVLLTGTFNYFYFFIFFMHFFQSGFLFHFYASYSDCLLLLHAICLPYFLSDDRCIKIVSDDTSKVNYTKKCHELIIMEHLHVTLTS